MQRCLRYRGDWQANFTHRLVPLSALALLCAVVGCDEPRHTLQSHIPMGTMVAYIESPEPIAPLDSVQGSNDARVRLGKLLFHDPRLSHDNTISCASCHDVSRGGDDGRQFSVGINGAVGAINSPTVLNATFNLAQFWDGRASDLKAQAAGPIHAPAEMGSSWSEVTAKLQSDPQILRQFQALFAGGITPESITECIVAYETQLVTPDSPFDKYLRGNKAAVDTQVVEGFRLFKELGCAACHQGKNVGGNLFARLGVMREFVDPSPDFGKAHSIAVSSSGTPSLDVHRIKVPTLRNIELTAPYLHDGSAGTLEDAVAVMGIYQLGCELSDGDIELIVKFLQSLTGVLSEDLQ